MSEARTRCTGTVPLVWKGAHFAAGGGSDTEESDSEQPLTEPQQVVAILDLKSTKPPPLPVEARHARATATAVRQRILNLPEDKRTHANLLALRIPIQHHATVAGWIKQQRSGGRKEQTIKTALCWALNPSRSQAWVCKKAGGSPTQAYAAKGLALHLRMHPFTRFEVQHGYSAYDNWTEQRDRRTHALVSRNNCRTLEAATALVALQRQH